MTAARNISRLAIHQTKADCLRASWPNVPRQPAHTPATTATSIATAPPTPMPTEMAVDLSAKARVIRPGQPAHQPAAQQPGHGSDGNPAQHAQHAQHRRPERGGRFLLERRFLDEDHRDQRNHQQG